MSLSKKKQKLVLSTFCVTTVLIVCLQYRHGSSSAGGLDLGQVTVSGVIYVQSICPLIRHCCRNAGTAHIVSGTPPISTHIVFPMATEDDYVA